MKFPIAILALSPFVVSAAVRQPQPNSKSDVSLTSSTQHTSQVTLFLDELKVYDGGSSNGPNIAHDGGNSQNAGLANVTSGAHRNLPMPLISVVVILGLI